MIPKVQVIVLAQHPIWQVLLMKTNERRGSFWQNITGKAEVGENALASAQREFREETGIDPQNAQWAQLDYTIRFQKQDKEVVESVFVAQLSSPCEIIIDVNEHQSYRWQDLHKLTDKDYLHECNYTATQKALEHLGIVSSRGDSSSQS